MGVDADVLVGERNAFGAARRSTGVEHQCRILEFDRGQAFVDQARVVGAGRLALFAELAEMDEPALHPIGGRSALAVVSHRVEHRRNGGVIEDDDRGDPLQ